MTESDAEHALRGEVRTAQRASALFEEHRRGVYQRGERLFAALMVGQWLFAIGLALVYSPYAWSGKVHSVHIHVYAAIVLGGAISSLPIAMALLWPGRLATR